MSKRITVFLYGVLCYVAFLLVFLYAIGFLTGVGVPKTINSGATTSAAVALVIDLLLLGLFAVQHTVMARPAFKRAWTRLVPPSVERSTFVLASSAVLALLFWQWRPLPAAVWNVGNPAGRDLLWILCGVGWTTVLLGSFMISHTHLFGLSQVWNRMLSKPQPEPRFQTSWLYGYVRHPLMLGFIVAFWAIPRMTVGHLVFAAAATGYIVVGTQLFEEKDLVRYIGEPYRAYQHKVPAFFPRTGRHVRVEELLPQAEKVGQHAEAHGRG
ncbi:MAG: isoprenylcysteine carboxylmethyltransferase family protein [Acidobacteria bacterium]|jgi:protein-S-isoprenylcysteine O-methyltransferase Ste14|nr:isoprenylcysteine carboxylmethyltransferase family protein [Acidobacteriota bacterium]